ncbi:hypothetical protein PMIN06_006052 [Paraphaeosphaeria minitans]|uniref:Haloacid dehalogenase n=1 Tax=Paraphaeosphaeria minitans TaxID=565426 RepID=A0A9P6GQA0_9PLEO|nr:hypothetical protein PMIN01_02522 [Paraphaeosphaeria minitans]
MHATQPLQGAGYNRFSKNLLLCFDAFGTLYKPNVGIPAAYALAAQRHGINCAADAASSMPIEQWTPAEYKPVSESFKQSYKRQSSENPNYGKETGLGAQKWWANVIRGTFQPFLKPQEEVPDALVAELLKLYSSSEGYTLFPDAKALFDKLRQARAQPSTSPWRWEKIVVGVISNSDDRVPSILSSLGLNVQPRRVGSEIGPIADSEDISFVVHSYDVGVEKPDKRIFNAARDLGKALGSMDECHKLYVGDSIGQDYLGATNAEWQSLLIDRNYKLGGGKREVESKAPLETRSIELVDNWVHVVRGLDELVEYDKYIEARWELKSKRSSPGKEA